jgi:hypothetical protein
MAIELTKSLFEENLNTKFWLREENGERAALDLIELRNGHSSALFEQFSLLFRGEPTKLQAQRTYAVEHGAIGGFDLFITPVDRNDQGTFYEAVFNRRVE